MKIKYVRGYESRGYEEIVGKDELEMDKFDLRAVLKHVLAKEFGSLVECERYFKEEYRIIEDDNDIDDVIDYVIEIMEEDKKSGIFEGELVISEEGFCKIWVDGKLFVG